MKRKPIIIGYATIKKVAERLAERGNPDADDFGLRAMGIIVESEDQLSRLKRAAFDILAGQQFRWPQQERLLEALGNSLVKNESQPN